jgi:hypothetical protein
VTVATDVATTDTIDVGVVVTVVDSGVSRQVQILPAIVLAWLSRLVHAAFTPVAVEVAFVVGVVAGAGARL